MIMSVIQIILFIYILLSIVFISKPSLIVKYLVMYIKFILRLFDVDINITSNNKLIKFIRIFGIIGITYAFVILLMFNKAV